MSTNGPLNEGILKEYRGLLTGLCIDQIMSGLTKKLAIVKKVQQRMVGDFTMVSVG